MSASVKHDLKKAFQRIPLLTSYRPDEFEITELNSHSNKNYRLRNEHMDVILRIPRADTNEYINRKTEIQHEKIAFSLGLSPACLWQNESGESLKQTIPQCSALTSSDLRNHYIIELLAKNLQLLHGCRNAFQGQVDLPALLDRYFGLLTKARQNELKVRLELVKKFLPTLKASHGSLVPSHNDLNENNLLLDKNSKLWIIDWEYSSMASPYWDLATICNAGEYTKLHCLFLLDAYNGNSNRLELIPLMQYREFLSLLTDCWMSVFNKKRS